MNPDFDDQIDDPIDDQVDQQPREQEHPGKIVIRDFPTKRDREILNFWLDIFLNITIIIALVFLIRTYVISPFQVYGPSMCNTLNFLDDKCQRGYGEYIIVNKLGYQTFFGWQVGAPKRGDIIVFHPPHNPSEYFIKRVIGLPGETVKLKNGDVFIFNEQHPLGFQLPEEYLSSINKDNTMPLGNISIFEVPPGNYYVMGDNRVASSDSRSCFKESPSGEKCGTGETTPFLPKENIEGKAWVILWPLDKLSILGDPGYDESKPAQTADSSAPAILSRF